jgi:hypothetical protein
LKDIFKSHCSSHPELKKFWKKKSKDLSKKYELEQVNKEEDQDEESETVEKKEKIKIKINEKLLTKKKERPVESEEESEEEIKVVKPKTDLKNGNGNTSKNNQNNNTAAKTPFKRIDDSLKDDLHKDLQDNSYEKYMNMSGDANGQLANEKLKFTKGRDFKKEKTKFKNKVGFGAGGISTQVRSIKLDSDSD